MEAKTETGNMQPATSNEYHMPATIGYGERPCPNCGHCPTCGRNGFRHFPYWDYWRLPYQYPWYVSDYPQLPITWSSSGSTSQTFSVLNGGVDSNSSGSTGGYPEMAIAC